MIESLPDLHILRLAQEAAQGGEELHTARILLNREMARRGLISPLKNNQSGFIDALADDIPSNPPDALNYWQTDYDKRT